MTDEALGLALLPVEFGDDDVRALYRAVGAPTRLAIPWRRRMEREGRIIRKPGSDGRFRSVGHARGG